MDRATIVYNPLARNAPTRDRLSAAAESLCNGGWEIDIQPTASPGHATLLAREAAAAGAGVVFACGGDGTVNEVVNGLAHGPAALGVLRGGMGDVFGKEAGISRTPELALRVLVEGERRRFDLGIAGLDADVVRAVPSGAKKRLGSTSYAIWGFGRLARYRSHGTLLRIDGVEQEAWLYWLLLGNTRSYGGIVNVTDRARVNDGLLDVYLFEGRGPRWLAATALRLATKRQDGGRGVTFRQVRELEILSLGLPVQIDGEYIGETPMRFSVAPSALDVMLPKGKAERLFSD
jgi:diacylglycerol kinase (ATP)